LGYTFTAQKKKKLLIGDENKKRDTFVDIFAQHKDSAKNIIIDTKYKKIKTSNDFANADVYQVSTYCSLHGTNHAILLYPRWGDEKPDIPPYFLNSETNKYKIEFKTINLKYVNLAESLDYVKDDIISALKAA
jgi:5-methylcytosine-specific restriction endonuclease McrBC regulatory subunit McrC